MTASVTAQSQSSHNAPPLRILSTFKTRIMYLSDVKRARTHGQELDYVARLQIQQLDEIGRKRNYQGSPAFPHSPYKCHADPRVVTRPHGAIYFFE
jgi:hypothetical protein